MRTDEPAAFLYWPYADQPMRLDALHWAVIQGKMLQYTGVGLTTLTVQLNGTAQPNNADSKLQREESTRQPRVTLIVPAEATQITTVNVPSAKPQHIRAIVPNLVEEVSAAELDTLHIAIGQRASDGAVPVAIVDRERFAQWIALIDAAGIRCEKIWVDALLLPHEPGTLALFVDNERALLRWSDHGGGAIDTIALEPLLTALLKRGEIKRIHWAMSNSANEASIQAVQSTLARLKQHNHVSLENTPAANSVWPHFINTLVNQTNHQLNLRQGDFELVDHHRLTWQRWRPTAIVAIVCVIALLLLNVIGGAVLNHRAAAAHAQNEALYRELFPQDKRLVNIAQQFRSHLGTTAAGGRSSFLQLFGQVAAVIKANPTEPALQIRSLLFDTTAGSLQVELIAPNIQVIDTLQKQLGTQHLRTKVLSAINENGTLVARLSVMDAE